MKKSLGSLIIIILLFTCQLGAQSYPLWGSLKAGPHATGFRIIDAVDYTRSYLPQSPGSRPIQLSIWYPATKGKTPMLIKDYYDTWKTQSITNIDTGYYREKYNWIVRGYASYNSRGVYNDSLRKIIQQTPTSAYRDAIAIKQKFPLLICAGAGDAATQSIRNEYLASHGYVVIAFPILNHHSADFDRGDGSLASTLAATNDIGFVVDYARQMPNVDINKLAVVGMMLQAGLNYQMQTQKLSAVISFEDDMTSLSRSVFTDPKKITVPVMAMATTEARADLSYLDTLLYADRYLMNLPGSRHLDIYQLEKVARPYEAGKYTNYEALALYMLNFLEHTLKRTTTAGKFISDNSFPKGTKEDKIKLTFLAGLLPQLTEKDFLSMLRYDQMEKAKKIYADNKQSGKPLFTRDNFSQLLLFERNDKNNDYLYEMTKMLLDAYPSAPVAERFLNIMGYQYIQARNIPKAIELFALSTQHFPSSVNVWDALADGYMEAGNKEKTIEYSKKVLAMLDASTLNAQTKQQLKTSSEEKMKKLGEPIPVAPIVAADFMQLNTGTKEEWLDLIAAPDQLVVASNSGAIYKSEDEGRTWVNKLKENRESLRSITFPSAGIGYGFGAKGTIFKSTDAGNTWNKIPFENQDNFFAASFINNSTGFAATGAGGIFKTNDGALSWKKTYENRDHFITCLYFSDGNIGFAGGGGGNATNGYGIILKTTNGGETWEKLKVELSVTITSIYMLSATTGFATGYNGLVIKTTDGGSTWNRQSLPGVRAFREIFFNSDRQGYLAGEAGTVFLTNDAGNSWQKLTTGLATDLNAIQKLDNKIFIAGQAGVILTK